MTMHTTPEDGQHMLTEGARQAAAGAAQQAEANRATAEQLDQRLARVERMLGITPLEVTPADVLAIVSTGRTPTADDTLGAELMAQVINAVIAKVTATQENPRV